MTGQDGMLRLKADSASRRSVAWGGVISSAISLLVAAFVFRFVLDAAYLTLMREFFKADQLIDVGAARLLLSYLLTAIAAAAVSLDVALRPGPGNVMSLLYLCVVITPILTLFGFGAQFSDLMFVLAMIGCLCLVVAVRLLLPAIRVPSPRRWLRNTLKVILLAMTAYVYGGLLVTRGIQQINFDLTLVYTFRAEYAQESFPFANYLIAWQAQVVNMAALAFVAYRRQWTLAFCVLAAQLLLFGMTNQKSFLLAPALVLGLLWLGRSPSRIAWGIVAGGTCIVLGAWGLFLLTEELLIPSILVRRLFFVPAELHLWYYDYFAGVAHPFVLLSNSLLGVLSPYPYGDGVPTTIGWAYLGLETRANAGWMADAYVHFGFGGMAAFSLLLAVFLRILDGAAAAVPLRLAAALVAVPTMALMNTGLLTVLLTHGFLFTALILWGLGSNFGTGREGRVAGSAIADHPL
jgi:hypothetical protein